MLRASRQATNIWLGSYVKCWRSFSIFVFLRLSGSVFFVNDSQLLLMEEAALSCASGWQAGLLVTERGLFFSLIAIPAGLAGLKIGTTS